MTNQEVVIPVIRAEFSSFRSIRVEVEGNPSIHWSLECDGKPLEIQQTETHREEQFVIYELTVLEPVELECRYEVFGAGRSIRVVPDRLVRTEAFERKYRYEEKLGVWEEDDTYHFAVWSPVAEQIVCIVYDQDEQVLGRHKMERQEQGTYHLRLGQESAERWYRYEVTTYVGTHEVVDPYAHAISVNGRYGVIADVEQTISEWFPKRVARPLFVKPSDAVIYEANIRDFTIDRSAGSSHPGQYAGVAERGTVSSRGHATGLDYLLDLGITHLQLLPVHFFETTDERTRSPYNWGYDPMLWFGLAGSYASSVAPLVRVREYADMVERLHEAGIRVTFDVVMNHVFVRERSSLEQLVPGYYFRYEVDGTLSNGTGVGNDTASERFMMRRLIVDCLTYFARVYRIDAFRFDLMGIHDIETMNEVRAALDAIDPTILVYGEGWDLATALPERFKAMSASAAQMPRIAHFNDVFRDALKGSTFSAYDRGFVAGDGWKEGEVRNGIAGSVHINNQTYGRFPEPTYSINYVEAHDNHTLYDKLKISCPEADELQLLRMSRLAQTIALLAQGIPFLHAGQEFLRTKQGVENSYNASDEINRMDWERRDDHLSLVTYIKTILQIRRMHGGFRLHRANQVRELLRFINLRPGVIAYEVEAIHSYDAWQRTLVVYNTTHEIVEVSLDHSRWNVHVQGDDASVDPLLKGVDRIQVLPLSTTIATC
ncbi:type I pullulanase [Exiguobacterium sp. UBA6309]|uniref:type I pullulanase n=1 Tax=Exiguobacterium sp. UBA6309 TaxID=1946499 RepID=UPI0025C3BF4F|nr:type I pullulanase [Exiguobacterium sp. UBA6309]